MQTNIAKIISLVLAPLVVVIPATFMVSFFGTKNLLLSFEWMLVSLFFILTLMAPLVFFVKKGQFANLDVSVREQRPLLFFIEFVFAAIYFSVLYLFHAPKELFIGIITIFALLIVFGIVNKFIKASGHVGMLSAIITLLVLKGGPIFLLGFLLVPILAWARLKTKRHTLNEVIAGTVVGVLVAALIAII